MKPRTLIQLIALSLITVATNPQTASNIRFSNTTPSPPAGATNVLWQHDSAQPISNISAYVPISTPNGCPSGTFQYPCVVANPSPLVNQTGNIGNTALYSVPANAEGRYLLYCTTIQTQTASSSSILPYCSFNWTNKTDNAQRSAYPPWSGLNSNANTTNLQLPQSMMGDVKAGSTIAFYTNGYSSTGATAMQYSIVFTVIYAGP